LIDLRGNIRLKNREQVKEIEYGSCESADERASLAGVAEPI
jgi:hypothetical protein